MPRYPNVFVPVSDGEPISEIIERAETAMKRAGISSAKRVRRHHTAAVCACGRLHSGILRDRLGGVVNEPKWATFGKRISDSNCSRQDGTSDMPLSKVGRHFVRPISAAASLCLTRVDDAILPDAPRVSWSDAI
jgi:hypothetical protein